MKQLVAIGGSMHGQLIEIDEKFGPGDNVCFALTDKPLPATPPKLQDLPEPPAEAYRIACITWGGDSSADTAIEYLVDTRLSGGHALQMMLRDVAELSALKRHIDEAHHEAFASGVTRKAAS